MAKNVKIQKSVHGKPLPDFISSMKGVQAICRDRAFEVRAEAAVQMIRHMNEGNAYIAPAKRVNQFAWRVTLVDPIDLSGNGIDRGSAAINIEKGRQPYVVRTVWKNSKGKVRLPGDTYGGMAGLEIISQAVAVVAARHRSEFR